MNISTDGTEDYTYDYLNQIIGVNDTASGTLLESFDYDTAGNRETDKANYGYDLLGRRTYSKEGELETEYIYSNNNIISEYVKKDGITLNNEYIYGVSTDDVLAVYKEEVTNTESLEEYIFCNTRVIPFKTQFQLFNHDSVVSTCETVVNSLNTETKLYFYHKNHLGSIIAISDETGSIVSEYDYDIFGKPTLTNGIDIGNTRLFTGREYSNLTGLYYNRARYYNPTIGRFISRDPIDIRDDVNLYSYVGNNGVMYVDRMGLEKALIFIGRDKLIFGEEWGTLYGAARIVYKDLLKRGYKEDNIRIIYGNELSNYTNTAINKFSEVIEEANYKEMFLVAHSNENEIFLDSSNVNYDTNVINKDTVNKLPDLGGDDRNLTIIGCLSGYGDNPIAQKIANQMEVSVKAPTSILALDVENSSFKYGGVRYYSNSSPLGLFKTALQASYTKTINKEAYFKNFIY